VPRSITQRTQVVQYASYALWAGSAGVSFLVLPFVFFFYEEEELYGFEARVRCRRQRPRCYVWKLANHAHGG
jgi:hypothetical protein